MKASLSNSDGPLHLYHRHDLPTQSTKIQSGRFDLQHNLGVCCRACYLRTLLFPERLYANRAAYPPGETRSAPRWVRPTKVIAYFLFSITARNDTERMTKQLLRPKLYRILYEKLDIVNYHTRKSVESKSQKL